MWSYSAETEPVTRSIYLADFLRVASSKLVSKHRVSSTKVRDLSSHHTMSGLKSVATMKEEGVAVTDVCC